jgi:manganese transport protein
MIGFIPRLRILTTPGLLYTAIGIMGATVMPHNLFLHSAIIQTRNYARTSAGAL